ncbi:MAG: SEC-C metal-binding domain-containing protein, partial [Gaiellaceae bacterium]
GSSSTGNLQYAGGMAADQPSALAAAAAAGAVGYAGEEAYDGEPMQPVETRVLDENEKLGRNDPCWCGSGKKFKKCHGA